MPLSEFLEFDYDDDPFATLDVEKDVIEDLESDLDMMKDKLNVKVDPTANELINIDLDILRFI